MASSDLGGIRNVLSQGKIGPLGGTFMEGVNMIVGFVHCSAPIYIGVSSRVFPFHIPPLRSLLLSPHLPVHQDELSSERRDSHGRVTFHRAFYA